ncbi:hypothetical protein D6851_00265 [Altericroceibacterium spongiae]|uniref:Uncharacterized protein n=1 Tax=Altericroceibacterium spongiae TaxID=2320269 RepID=A0A420EQP7_9SPHN|nr:hypothetical protein [Altericroceibacterium spongiae]RKF22991.1 hypothetical protein D6851_00265 [Altericroceibacterium spongiae]
MAVSKLYIASKDVLGGAALGKEHLYLIYDPDVDNDGDPSTNLTQVTGDQAIIIRGGEFAVSTYNPIEIEISFESSS